MAKFWVFVESAYGEAIMASMWLFAGVGVSCWVNTPLALKWITELLCYFNASMCLIRGASARVRSEAKKVLEDKEKSDA